MPAVSIGRNGPESARAVIERLETRLALSAQVTQLVLVNADTDQDLFVLSEGMPIDEAFLPTDNVNIRADVTGDPTHVRFDLDALIGYRNESNPPYTIGGDNGGDYQAWELPIGTHVIGAVPFFDSGGVATEGQGLAVTVNIAATQPSGTDAGPISYSQIDVSWRDNSDYETAFVIERSAGGGAFETLATVSPGVEDYVDQAVAPGVAYLYRVAAMTAGNGQTLFSRESPALIDLGAPAPAANFSAQTESFSRVALSWDDESDNEQGFLIERSTDGVGFGVVGQTAALIDTFDDLTVAAATTYFYRVAAFNPGGNSAYTPVVQVTTYPVPSFENRPGENNTGPTSPNRLQKSGNITTTQDGQVIESIVVKGRILVQHNNVTIRDFRVIGRGLYGIEIADGVTGTLIEHGEIANASSALLRGGGFTARYLDLHHSGADGIKPTGDVVVEGCWIHHLGTTPAAHADGVQVVGGSNMVFRGNYFDMPVDIPGTNSNSAFIIDNSIGPVSNILIEDNWLNGGNYTLYVLHKTGSLNPPPSDVTIRGNWFGPDYRFGTRSIDVELVALVWEENRRWDTGELIDLID